MIVQWKRIRPLDWQLSFEQFSCVGARHQIRSGEQDIATNPLPSCVRTLENNLNHQTRSREFATSSGWQDFDVRQKMESP